MDRRLNLAEELLLLALKEEKGTVFLGASTALPYGLAGAVIIELIEAGLLRLDGKDLVAEPRGSARDEILDEILAAVRSSPRARRLDSWVGKLGRSGGKIRRKLLDRLVAKGILTREERRVLAVFPSSRYPTIDSRPEFEIRNRVRAGVFGVMPPDPRTAALISLADTCGLTGEIVAKGERREAKKRAKEITQSHPVGGAVARAVEAVRAAAVIATGT
jgi:hypothetical protein